mmetsp:Transcript_19309/g.41252  ORF Transcript_19309/g.41252 Transcript_19309/m.41252 type:complete len:92 (+) Transcript_19309:1244-1519(+)
MATRRGETELSPRREDVLVRNEKWNTKYQVQNGVTTRVIMWDMTGIEAFRFSSAENQRNTFGKYYASNRVKGGIGMQICAWLVTWDGWGYV